MSAHETHWYRNAVVYAVDVEAFQDSDGDGVGDFQGLTGRLDYLSHVGVDCLWLLPFYPSPNRDNGYDVTDYYGVDPRVGTLGDFVDFVREAEERGIHVLVDLVLNHTSDQHPWFQAARTDPESKYRDYYVWDEDPPTDHDRGQVFPGEVEDDRVWTYDSEAGAYYYHRFYPFQPDLDLSNPNVREEIRRIVGFWLRLGVSGFRVDAAGLMVGGKRPGAPAPEDPYSFLRDLHSFVSRYRGDAVLLAEADVRPADLPDFVEEAGMDLLMNFRLAASLFAALATGRADRLASALDDLPSLPADGCWLNFLRNYDELNLGSLPDADREAVFAGFAPESGMRIYGRGIRRRLAPMLDGVSTSEASGGSSEQRSDGDGRRVELALSLLFSMPGASMLVYGDELGMGEDLSLPGRTAVRTPMQWSATANAGFSTADPGDLTRPVVSEGSFSYEHVNVADQWAEPDSLLNFVEHLVGTRHETPEIGRAEMTVVGVDDPAVFAHRYDEDETTVAMAHNLADEPHTVAPDLGNGERPLLDLLGTGDVCQHDDGRCELDLDAYGYRWLRLGRRGSGVETE